MQMSVSSTAYQLIRPRVWWLEVPLLLAFNLLLVASAYLSFNVPFSPVPITGQTLGILLVAMALGRTRAVGVVTAYLLEGAVGMPVFAGGKAGMAVLAGPTGGYLLGFFVASFLVGWLADRNWDKSFARSLAAMSFGTAVIFVCGLTQLSLFVPAASLLEMGLYPFIPGALLKLAIAGVILPSIWRFVRNQRR
jgi:biotin transport system substrate-specific component